MKKRIGICAVLLLAAFVLVLTCSSVSDPALSEWLKKPISFMTTGELFFILIVSSMLGRWGK